MAVLSRADKRHSHLGGDVTPGEYRWTNLGIGPSAFCLDTFLLSVDQRVERTTAAFEKAAVLFNLAAALSAEAAAADLTSDAGCKRAARRYQVPQHTLCSQLVM